MASERTLEPHPACASIHSMSTVAEIERAIGQLSPEQWLEIRRWMDAQATPPAWPVPPPNVEREELERIDAEIEAEFPTARA
jgi:hypothetical protein